MAQSTAQQELEKQRLELKREIEQTQELLDKNKKNTKESLGQLSLINRKLNLQENIIENISKDINLLDNSIYKSQRDINRLQVLLETLKQEYAKSMLYAYKNRSSSDFLNFIFSASSFNDAIKCLDGMLNLNIEFCEQPMRTWYDDRLPELKQKTNIKIMADESCYNHHDARRLINSASCDYINIKFAKSGGINEGLKIHQIAYDSQIPCMIGSMLESRIALSANLHFAYACPGIKYFDLDTCLLGHLVDPVNGGLTYDGFFLDIPDAPGIGADADEDFLKTCEMWRI